MKEVDGQRAILEVIAEDVSVVALLGGSGALLLLKLMDGGELIAQLGGGFKLLGFGGGCHACGQCAFQFGVAAFQQQARVTHGARVNLRRRQSLDAGAQAAMNVVLQAGARVIAGEIDLATGNQKAAMNQLNHAPSQAAGKVGAKVGGAVFQQATGDKNFGEAVAHGELDEGIAFVVLEQNVEARLALLDEVGFERQRLGLVADKNVFEIDGLAHKRAGFGVGLR